MKDSSLLRIALGCSIIGLIGLFFILLTTQIPKSDVATLQNKDVGSTIRLSGVVEKITSKDNLTQITISQNSKIKGVVFEKINVSKGNQVDITGTLGEFRGEKEILIKKIIVY